MYITGLSIKVFLSTLIGILLFGLYVNTILNGENSLRVLTELRDKKLFLKEEAKRIKIENAKMQKELFQSKVQMEYIVYEE